MVRSRRGPPGWPPGTGPRRWSGPAGPSRPGRCWSWPPRLWSGWVGIAQKTGFGLVSPLPGIWPALHLDTAITLPVGVEVYAAYALRAWLARDRSISGRTRRFAKWSAICSFALGMAGQVAYHLMAQAGTTRASWAITTVVSCLPVLVLAMGTALAQMLRADAEAVDVPDNRTGPRAVLRSLSWSAEDHDGPGRRQPEADRDRSVSRDHSGPKPGRQAAAGSGDLTRAPRSHRQSRSALSPAGSPQRADQYRGERCAAQESRAPIRP